MNEITELYLEHKATTNDSISAAILTLAETIKNNKVDIETSIDYLVESLKNDID